MKESSEFLTMKEFFIETEVGVSNYPLITVSSCLFVLTVSPAFRLLVGDLLKLLRSLIEPPRLVGDFPSVLMVVRLTGLALVVSSSTTSLRMGEVVPS